MFTFKFELSLLFSICLLLSPFHLSPSTKPCFTYLLVLRTFMD